MSTTIQDPRLTIARFCIHCGAPTQNRVKCPSCGEELPDTRFGWECAGRYRTEKLIGAGGYGRVYRAWHMGLSAPVAVKNQRTSCP